jgi:dephospho-CoA kinase
VSRRPFRLGLTGSVGMGKSTTAQLFAEAGVPVWDADGAVHRLYAPGGLGAAALADLVPDAVHDGGVDRARLRDAVLADPTLLGRIEARIHPLVAGDRAAFADAHAAADLILLDIPLLFETGGEKRCDVVVVVSAPPFVQRARVLARPGMTEARLAQILAQQMPDREKRARADFVVETGLGKRYTLCRIAEIISILRSDARNRSRYRNHRARSR